MYIPCHAHSNSSTLDGLTSPEDMARRIVSIGATAGGLTDHGSISGVPSVSKAFKEACKNCGYQKNSHADNGKGKCLVKGVACNAYEPANLKLISGIEWYVCEGHESERSQDNRKLRHMCALAKNKAGWVSMMQATSAANKPENFYYKPRLSLESLGDFAKGNWVTFSGHPGSLMADVIFHDPKAAYRAKTYDEAKGLVKDWSELQKELIELAGKHQELFGKGNFFLEVQLLDAKNIPAAEIIAKLMRWTSKKTGIPCLATPDAHYAFPEDAPDQRVLLCAALKTTLKRVEQQAANGEDVTLGAFFRSNNYCIPDQETMRRIHESVELSNTLLVGEMCESISFGGQPKLPAFRCPDGKSDEVYLAELCEVGLRNKISTTKQEAYRQRLKAELEIFNRVGISSYFLIVHDLMKYACGELGSPLSDGRGSAGGCLTGYLLNIHDCDPIEANLIFERFYNDGRNTPGKVSMPDIDLDFPPELRQPIIEYLRNKYGKDQVAQIATFSSLQGRQALTEVLKAHDWGTFDLRKEITKRLPQDAAIADKLQEMQEEEGYSSSIVWALRHQADEFRDWVSLSDEGEYSGPLAAHFAQAVRLEGCKRGRGRHASGVIIAPEPLSGLCPMLYDENLGEPIAGFEFGDLEALGLMKLDVLGQVPLSRLKKVWELIEKGPGSDG